MHTKLRTTGPRLAVLAATITAIVLTPAAASADTGPTGREFAEHVVHCAQTTGFDGDHNPGMHQGLAGFHHAHTC